MSTEKQLRPSGDFVILNHAIPPVKITFSDAANSSGERPTGEFVIANHALPPVKVEMAAADRISLQTFAPDGCLRKDHSYDLMNFLSLYPTVDYYATAFVNELFVNETAEDHAFQAIYDRPLEFGKRVHRIFVIDTPADLDRLDLRRKDLLKQQLLTGVDLKFIERNALVGYLERKRLATKVENIACVGRLAAGVLQADGTNLIVKTRREIEDAFQWFQACSKAADEAGLSLRALLNLAA